MSNIQEYWSEYLKIKHSNPAIIQYVSNPYFSEYMSAVFEANLSIFFV